MRRKRWILGGGTDPGKDERTRQQEHGRQHKPGFVPDPVHVDDLSRPSGQNIAPRQTPTQTGQIQSGPARSSRQSRAVRSRIALPITLTEDSAMAAAAMIGESRIPKIGYSTPAATGTPRAL